MSNIRLLTTPPSKRKSSSGFQTGRIRRPYIRHLKDEFPRGHANAATLQDKTQDQTQGDGAQKSKDKKDNPSKKGARKCVCDEIHEFDECSYIVSSSKRSDWTEDKKIRDQIKQKFQEKPWILKVIKRIRNINILNKTITSSTELKTSFSFGNISFANIVLRKSTSLNKSVIYDSGCSDPLTYDKNRFLGEIKLASGWIKTSNGRMKVKEYGTMQVLGKSGNKIIKMKFANIAYVFITTVACNNLVVFSFWGFRTFFWPHFNLTNYQKVIFCYCSLSRWNDLYIDDLDDKFNSYMCTLLSKIFYSARFFNDLIQIVWISSSSRSLDSSFWSSSRLVFLDDRFWNLSYKWKIFLRVKCLRNWAQMMIVELILIKFSIHHFSIFIKFTTFKSDFHQVHDFQIWFSSISAKPGLGCERREPAPAAQPGQPSQPQSQLGETRKRLSVDISQKIN